MLGHSYKFCLGAREVTIPVDQYPFGGDLRAGVRRGPRALGEGWLVLVGGSPLPDTRPMANRGSRDGSFAALVTVESQEAAVEVVTVSKRRREGGVGGARKHGSAAGNVTMLDVSKNLLAAGSSSQARPSS